MPRTPQLMDMKRAQRQRDWHVEMKHRNGMNICDDKQCREAVIVLMKLR